MSPLTIIQTVKHVVDSCTHSLQWMNRKEPIGYIYTIQMCSPLYPSHDATSTKQRQNTRFLNH